MKVLANSAKARVEKLMGPIEYTSIFLIILFFSGYQSWKIGKDRGIRGTVDFLQKKGYLELADDPA